jgi:uncharacterized protein (TIGR00251 family)
MSNVSDPITLTPSGVTIRVRIQPRSSQDRIAGLHGGALKVTLTAPPVEGEANKGLIAFLARKLKTPRSAVTILYGHKSRDKQVLIASHNPAGTVVDLRRLLATPIDKGERDG